jgi:uncharacterized protein
MPAASQPLFELQNVETRLDARRSDLRSIRQRLAGNPEIEIAAKRAVALEETHHMLQSNLRSLERQTDDLAATIKRLNNMLYGGKIHDTRELASAEAEIAHARDRQSALEDEEIELLERLEETEATLDQSRRKLEELRTQFDGSIEGLRTEEAEAGRQIAELESRRSEMAATIDPKQMAIYERLRQRLGHGVSAVDGGTCQWCRVQIPSQDVQHARGDAIIMCGNCGRILYTE